jgi:hypothetical protein
MYNQQQTSNEGTQTSAVAPAIPATSFPSGAVDQQYVKFAFQKLKPICVQLMEAQTKIRM